MRKGIFFVGLIIIVTVSLAGCKSTQDKLTEKALEVGGRGKVKVDIDSGQKKIKITNKEDNSSVQINNGGRLAVPGGWPDEAKIYPKAKIISVLNVPGSLQFIAQTNDNPEEIKSWYQAELTKTKWQVLNNFKMAGGWITVYKKDGQQLSISITNDEDGKGYNISHNYTKNN